MNSEYQTPPPPSRPSVMRWQYYQGKLMLATNVFPEFKWPTFFFFLNSFKLNLEERH